jgi:hypothetical protein
MVAHLPLTFVLLIGAAGIALAHPLDGPSSQPIGPMELEIIQFRREIMDAVKAKDAARLREIYAEGFTHTQGSGRSTARTRASSRCSQATHRSRWRRRTS